MQRLIGLWKWVRNMGLTLKIAALLRADAAEARTRASIERERARVERQRADALRALLQSQYAEGETQRRALVARADRARADVVQLVEAVLIASDEGFAGARAEELVKMATDLSHRYRRSARRLLLVQGGGR